MAGELNGTAHDWGSLEKPLPTLLADHQQFKSVRYFGSLDGLRCISILAVIWHHAGGHSAGAQSGVLGRGYMGVDLFFVISGFLITTLLLRERERCGQISLKMFYLRRSLRIFPLYYTIVALYIVLVVLFERQPETATLFFRNLPYYLTYTSNVFVDLPMANTGNPGRVIFYFAWSLATEEQFYLIWPLIFRFFKGWWPVATILLALICSQLFRFGELQASTTIGVRSYRAVTSISAGICFGVLLAHMLHSNTGFDWVRRLLGWRWSSPCAGLLLAGLLALPVAETPLWRLSSEFAMALLVGSCVVREDHLLAGLLSVALVRSVGVVSYGMYLLHMLAMRAGDAILQATAVHNSLARFALGAGLAYAVAYCSYRYYEGWFLALKERLGRVAPQATA